MTGNWRRGIAFAGLGALAGLLFFAFQPAAHALPEYATRTGEPCATCHVNPAGGGPRTVRGNLWIAAGRPDKVPPLPGDTQPAPGAAPAGGAADGGALFARLGCGGCHGAAGAGGSGPALDQGELPAGRLRQVVRQGKGAMAGLPPDVSDAELGALVQYVQAIGRGEAKAQALGPAKPARPRVQCSAGPLPGPAWPGCRGN